MPSGKVGGSPAVAVDLGTLAVELRLATDPDNPPSEPLASVLSRALRAAKVMVNERVHPATPQDLRDIGIVAVASYVFDRPTAPQGERFANVWRNSGAEMMLSRWVSRRALPIGGEIDEADEAEDGTMPLIDAALSAADPISVSIQVKAERNATLQAIARVAFAAEIEASFLEDGQPVAWERVIPFTNETIIAGDRRLVLNPALVYRARLISGGPVRVLLG